MSKVKFGMNLLEKLNDLLEQAITDKSHYYTASVIKEAIEYISKNESNNGMSSMQTIQIKEHVGAILEELKALTKVL